MKNQCGEAARETVQRPRVEKMASLCCWTKSDEENEHKRTTVLKEKNIALAQMIETLK
jgi:hypothetical protein